MHACVFVDGLQRISVLRYNVPGRHPRVQHSAECSSKKPCGHCLMDVGWMSLMVGWPSVGVSWPSVGPIDRPPTDHNRHPTDACLEVSTASPLQSISGLGLAHNQPRSEGWFWGENLKMGPKMPIRPQLPSNQPQLTANRQPTDTQPTWEGSWVTVHGAWGAIPHSMWGGRGVVGDVCNPTPCEHPKIASLF